MAINLITNLINAIHKDRNLMEKEFKIRPYAKWQLAQLYFPMTPTRESAVRNLYNLMRSEPELMRALRAAHYTAHTRIFTPRQVRLLVQYLGEP